MIMSCDEKGNKYLIINNKIISSLDSAIVLGIIEIDQKVNFQKHVSTKEAINAISRIQSYIAR